MILPGYTFRRVLELPKVDWTKVSSTRKEQVVARCAELLRQLPQVEAIEGVRRLDGAKYLFERALLDTLETLGSPLTEETRAELLIDEFIR
jgi:hypothetical protein